MMIMQQCMYLFRSSHCDCVELFVEKYCGMDGYCVLGLALIFFTILLFVFDKIFRFGR